MLYEAYFRLVLLFCGSTISSRTNLKHLKVSSCCFRLLTADLCKESSLLPLPGAYAVHLVKVLVVFLQESNKKYYFEPAKARLFKGEHAWFEKIKFSFCLEAFSYLFAWSLAW